MKYLFFRNRFVSKGLPAILPLIFLVSICQGQKSINSPEKEYHNTIEKLCQYLSQHDTGIDLNNSTIQNYILLDYVLNDTSQERIKRRIPTINSFIASFKHFVDSVGISNLDAKPVTYYKSDSSFYKPFLEDLKDAIPQTFAYYDRRHPEKPYGYLLFDKKTSKLISWILINQGGYYYFLIFNLI